MIDVPVDMNPLALPIETLIEISEYGISFNLGKGKKMYEANPMLYVVKGAP